MKQKAVIFDIDNTLMSQSRRLVKAYNSLMETNHILDDFKQENKSKFELPIQLVRNLSVEKSKEYYRTFLTMKYYDKEDGYNLDGVEGAKEFLHFLQQKGVKIIYMTARINSPTMNHSQITYDMLQHFGFPYDENIEIHFLESNYIPDSSADFHTLADAFKSKQSKELTEKYDILAGVGDAKSDISAFKSANITAIQARTTIPESMYDENADKAFKNWEELYNFKEFINL